MATSSSQLVPEYKIASAEFEQLAKRANLSGNYTGLHFSSPGLLNVTGTQTISGTRLDWSKPGLEGYFRSTPYDNVSGVLNYGSVYIFANYKMEIREEVWNPDPKNYRRTRLLLILNDSNGIAKQYLLDESSYEISHAIPIDPTFYWGYTYATLKTINYKKIDYSFNFTLFSGTPPGYIEYSIPLDPAPPPPPPPVCDVKIGIDESTNQEGYFCMSFQEYQNFLAKNKNAQDNLDSAINTLNAIK